MAEQIVKRLEKVVSRGSTVAVLGLAYKPFSHVIEESQGIYMAKALSKAGLRVIAYDPLANEGARTELAYHALVIDSLAGCLEQADVVLITTPDPAFKALKATDFRSGQVTVVDFWRILDKECVGQPNIRYVPFGRSKDDEENGSRLQRLWGSFFF
jgi:UDPglucose 6-dehydrogenase